MYFPLELWNEIKEFAGIHSISTDWSFPFIYEGNWIQFYLEWLQPTSNQIDRIQCVNDVKRAFLKESWSRVQWNRVHFLNKVHGYASKMLLPILQSCNALLEVEPFMFTKEYDLIEFYIPFYVGKEKEMKLLQSIHALLLRCNLSRIVYSYQPGSLILTVPVMLDLTIQIRTLSSQVLIHG